MAERWGKQWVVDPSGHRWRVESMARVSALLKDEDGRELGVGRSILRDGFASGAWKLAEFEESTESIPPDPPKPQ